MKKTSNNLVEVAAQGPTHPPIHWVAAVYLPGDKEASA
jgi:hypothetical protein